MVSFNRAEKRHTAAIDGIMASRSLHKFAKGNLQAEGGILDLEDYEQYIDTLYVEDTFTAGGFDIWGPVNAIKPTAKQTARVNWREVVFDVYPIEVSNDNSVVDNEEAPVGRASLNSSGGVGVQIAQDLSRLQNGWAGEGSVPPTPAAIRDLLSVVMLLPTVISEPETEVDPDDGSVVLRWANEESSETFSLTFFGKGEVAGYLSSSAKMPAWKVRVTDGSQITSRLMSEDILDLVTG